MKDHRYVVQIDYQGFRVNYRIRTGLLYVGALRRDEASLRSFLDYIRPEHAIWEEWSEGSGKNWTREKCLQKGKVIGYFQRQGQYSLLVYKATYPNLLLGIRDMADQGITVTKVARLGNKGGLS